MDALRMFVCPNIRTMKSLRVLCAAAFATTFLYTIAVGVNHGFNFAPIFIGDVLAMNWAGHSTLIFLFTYSFQHCGWHGAINFPRKELRWVCLP